MELILASQSPRRREILTSAGYKFTVISDKVSESFDKNLNLDEQIIAIARTKGEAIVKSNKLPQKKEYLILSADTVVVIDHKTFGKPKDRTHAKQMLLALRGKVHSVKTGVCFIHLPSNQIHTGIETSLVCFRNFTESELEAYLDTNEWVDKAGAYAIQGEGGKLVSSIEGSLTNIIGLPIELVQRMMVENGWDKHCR